MEKQDKKWMWLVFLGVFLVAGITGAFLTVVPVTDESGTIANAMYLLGYDWSNYLQEYGAFYYKYGMALFYYPIFGLIKNPYLAYRTIMVVQALLLALNGLSAYLILRRHLAVGEREIKPFHAAIMAFAMGVLPASLLYSMYARADVVLIVAPWVCLLFLLEAYKAYDNKKKRMIYSILLSAAAVFAYMSHTRGVVILIAAVLAVILSSLLVKKAVVHLPAFIASTGLLLILDHFLTAFFKNALWSAGIKHANMDVFDPEVLLDMFSPGGILTMVKSIIGWTFNALSGTLGLIGLGAVAAVVFVVLYLRKKKNITAQEMIASLFSVLVLLGTAGMGLLFFFEYLHARFNMLETERYDMIIYGRYIVGAFGPLTLLALYALFKRRDVIGFKCRTAALFGFLGILFLFAWKVAYYLDGVSVRSRYFISLNTFVETKKGQTSAVFEHLSDSIIAAGIFSLILFMIILIMDYREKRTAISVLVLASFLSLFTINFVNVRYARNEFVEERADSAEAFIRGFEGIADEFPYLAIGPTAVNMRVYQVMFRQFDIVAMKSKAIKDVTDLIMIQKYNDIDFRLYQNDFYQFDNYNYENKPDDVVIVKGEKLKLRLEAMGYTFTKLVPPEIQKEMKEGNEYTD